MREKKSCENEQIRQVQHREMYGAFRAKVWVIKGRTGRKTAVSKDNQEGKK